MSSDENQDQALTRQKNRIQLYKRVFGTKEGKEILLDLMNRFYINDNFEGDIGEGKRRVVSFILKQAKYKIDDLDRLMAGDLGG